MNSSRLLKLVVAVFVLGMFAGLGADQPARAQGIDWVRHYGLIEGATVHAAVFGDDGSSYIAGYVVDAFPDHVSAGGWDAFVRAYNADGSIRWTRKFGSDGYEFASGIAVDSAGRVTVTGNIFDGALPGFTHAGGADVFVRTYDNDGTELWTDQFGSWVEDWSSGAAVDSSGNAYISGFTELEFSGTEHIGGFDAFVRSYDRDGNERWTVQFGTDSIDRALDIAVSPDDLIYVVGMTAGNFPGFSLHGSEKAFIRVMDSAGTVLRTEQYGGGEYSTTSASGVAIDPAGRVYVVGAADSSYVRAYDPKGVQLWEQVFGTNSWDYTSGVRIDADGNVLIEGVTGGVLTGSNASPGEYAFVRAYDANGNELWTEQFDDQPPTQSWLQALGVSSGIELHVNHAWYFDGSNEDLVGYRVLRSTSSTGPFQEIASLPLQASVWLDDSIPPNTLHYYRVVVVDVRGNRSLPSRTVASKWVELEGTVKFERTWERTDLPVRANRAARTWMWGPEPFTEVLVEEYVSAPDGMRQVQYFDKSRMEDNSYRGMAPWDVTNGLLAVELVTGYMQLSDDEYIYFGRADINIAGDPGSGPTYAMLQRLLFAGTQGEGAPVSDRLHSDGTVTWGDQGLAAFGVTGVRYVEETMHTIAGPFWEFMNSTGVVYKASEFTHDTLFLNPFYATGYPITEAYWTRVEVAGTPHDVLVQCFERRCLTYTPGNPEGWKVEAGNVGWHYYQWRYGIDQLPPTGQIAFVARTGADMTNYDIVVAQVDGTGAVNLTNDPAYDTRPQWSPDGRRILFTSDRDGGSVIVMDADGGNLRKVTEADIEFSSASWSPDGQQIAFALHGDIHTINVDGTRLRNLTNSPDVDRDPAWSPNGGRIAYTSEQPPEPDASRPREVLRVMNINGSGIKELTSELYIARAPAWSPDGTRIAFEHSEDRQFGYTESINLVYLDGGFSRPIAVCSGYHGCYGFSWSPDSKYIAIARNLTRLDTGGGQLFTVSDVTTGELLATGDTIASPSWSPDDNYLAFILDGDLAILPVTGGEILINQTGFWIDSGVTWSPAR
jgi:Tol biopolymer transport system component